MRTPLLSGRDFSRQDRNNSPQVAIVNETLVKRFYAGQNPIGRIFRIDSRPGMPQQAVEIVGVMKDAKYESLREATLPTAFFPISQLRENQPEGEFELRTAVKPSTLASAVEEAVGSVNKTIPLEFMTLAQQVDDSLVQERLLATLSAFFGALALLLAAIGLYGALSYLVAQRRTEFGIRMALGAMPESILRLVMRDVAMVLGAGIAAGVSISLLTASILQKLLFGLVSHDATTMIGAICVLAAVALTAAYLPARRAMRSDPMTALRYE
jgi:predicted permease